MILLRLITMRLLDTKNSYYHQSQIAIEINFINFVLPAKKSVKGFIFASNQFKKQFNFG